MNMYYILVDKIPVPVDDVMEWAAMFENSLSRRVAHTKLSGGIYVSTVFLGLDHRWGDGPPLLFETMVFGGKRDQYQDRYSTWKEAEAGHLLAVIIADNDRWNWLVAWWYRLRLWFERYHYRRLLENIIVKMRKPMRTIL